MRSDDDGLHDPREIVRAHLRAPCIVDGVDLKLSELEARDAEVGVFNWAVRTAEERSIAKSWKQRAFASLYATKAKSVLANLRPNPAVCNPGLLERLRTRELLPHDVASLSPLRMNPTRWAPVLDAKTRKEDYIYNEKPVAMTDQFKCGRCKMRECAYRELQLRSCDEPVSLFITCLKCGNNWRIG